MTGPAEAAARRTLQTERRMGRKNAEEQYEKIICSSVLGTFVNNTGSIPNSAKAGILLQNHCVLVTVSNFRLYAEVAYRNQYKIFCRIIPAFSELGIEPVS